MHITSVSVIGGGYLGSRLALALNRDKYEVKVSFRSKPPKAKVKGVQYVYCDVSDGQVIAEETLFQADCVIICIPPGFRRGLGEIYPANITAILEMAQNNGCSHVIYTSSTGIYSEAGFFDEVVTGKGQVLYWPQSISWSKLDEIEFKESTAGVMMILSKADFKAA